jgi:cysteinyl-tRNA synthetase
VGLVLTNTLTGRKEPLAPRKPGHVGLYWCGVTVYARAHVGHARFLIVSDLLHRYLLARGLKVNFVRNVTDIDDKIIARAAEEGIDPAALSARETAALADDVARLKCLPPTSEPRATAHIDDMVAFIERLVAKGIAYPVADGSVYFRVRRFAGYGKLSHRRLDDMEVGENDPQKDDPHDFALWKGAKPGEPTWPSPWGAGRPGWHLECSAMSARYLGQPFDIHGGGTDLVFPHHENELAQSEADAEVPLANLWVHNGMITFGAEKMSKSLGNVLGIAEVTAEAPGEALRLLYHGTHYRAPLEFTRDRLAEKAENLDRFYETLARADEAAGGPPPGVAPAGALTGSLSPFLDLFVASMDDDLNAAKALGHVFDRVRDLNRALDAGDRAEAAAARTDLARAGAVLGVMTERPAAYLEARRDRGRSRAGITEAEIEAAIAERNAARKRKDFARADAIRAELKARGISLEDAPSGTLWRAD